MKHFAVVVFLFVATLFATTAAAAEETASKPETTVAQPWAKWSIGLKLGGTLAFPDGKVMPKPMSISLGLNMTNPIDENWGWSTEIGAGSPTTIFNPCPYVFTGPVFTVVAGKFNLMPWILYQFNPPYDAGGGKITNYIGLGITPSIPIGDTLVVALPIGGGFTEGGPKIVWQWNIGPKLIFKLPY